MNRKYRKTIIAGNWKMNKTAGETAQFAAEIKPLLPKTRSCETLICLPALNITAAQKAFKGSKISIGAETLHYEKSGERREYYAETDFTVNKKVLAALGAGLTPIVCIGESLQQRELNVQMELLDYQLMVAVAGVSAEDMKHIVIAYEPIWAIGTGKTATAAQAQEVCEHIRATIRKKYDARTARAVSILYGGSMNTGNAGELLSMPDIDGGLIGGAALKSADFARIIEIAGTIE